jgi:hypothetical protein
MYMSAAFMPFPAGLHPILSPRRGDDKRPRTVLSSRQAQRLMVESAMRWNKAVPVAFIGNAGDCAHSIARRTRMFRNLLAGVAALALMSGAAYAQDSYSSQSTTTEVAPAPTAPADTYSKTTTRRSTDAFGNQSQETHSVSKSQAMTPDGDTTTVTHSRSISNGSAPDDE